MRILKQGSTGPAVQLLQLAINRALSDELALDGIFGTKTKTALMRFQALSGLAADGIVGPVTHRALVPYYTGFAVHRVFRGDTIWAIAKLYGTTPEAIFAANPGINAANLQIGSSVTVPLPFDIVPTTVDYTHTLVSYCVRGLAARYPFIGTGELGRSVMGKALWVLSFGAGDRTVFYNAAHHANEWICVPLLLRFFEQLCRAYAAKGSIFGTSARELFARVKLYIAPCVDPDGMDLVTGELSGGEYYNAALRIAREYPQFPFPSGWKANIRGVDLNLQYPAGWEQARENKAAQGIVSPAPADFVGNAPLTAPESRAMYDFTLALSPQLVLAYHTQGEVIYWKYLDIEPKGARKLGERFAALSGYALEDTPFASGFAGYKDWFIQELDRPGYTVEAGRGVNPLPLSQFDKIYADNLGILVSAAMG